MFGASSRLNSHVVKWHFHITGPRRTEVDATSRRGLGQGGEVEGGGCRLGWCCRPGAGGEGGEEVGEEEEQEGDESDLVGDQERSFEEKQLCGAGGGVDKQQVGGGRPAPDVHKW